MVLTLAPTMAQATAASIFSDRLGDSAGRGVIASVAAPAATGQPAGSTSGVSGESRCTPACGVLMFGKAREQREPRNAHSWFHDTARAARTQAKRRGVHQFQARGARRA